MFDEKFSLYVLPPIDPLVIKLQTAVYVFRYLSVQEPLIGWYDRIAMYFIVLSLTSIVSLTGCKIFFGRTVSRVSYIRQFFMS